MIWPRRYEDVNRVELLKEARKRHPLHLLECVLCGWQLLTMETAKVSAFETLNVGYGAVCADQNDCFRRQRDKVAPPIRKRRRAQK